MKFKSVSVSLRKTM